DEPVRRLVQIQGYVPLLNPVAALAGLPSVLEHRLADYAPQQRLRDYYGVGPAAVWLLAAFITVRFVHRRFGFGLALLLSAAPLIIQPRVDPLFVVKPVHRDADAVLRALPNDASIIAQTTLVPHLPVRENVKLFGRTELTSDYVVLMPSAFRWPYDRDEYVHEVEQLLQSGAYGVRSNDGTVVVLQRGLGTDGNDAVRALLK
ncbi:MAG: hypothetical protein ACO1OB_02430, partial [Archangium sp.]